MFKMNNSQTPELVCPVCRSLFNEKAPACPECYRVFSDKLAPTLSALYGNPPHRGPVPARFGAKAKRERRAAELRAALAEAVKNEDFETACRLRDELRETLRESEVDSDVMV